MFRKIQSKNKEESTETLLEPEENKTVAYKTGVSSKENRHMPLARQTWYWTIIGLTIATGTTIFAIPIDAFPIAYIRWPLGLILVTFLPGYAFVKALFPQNKAPFKTDGETLNFVEIGGLSIGLSLAFNAIVGYLLDYLSLGIGLTPMTISFLAITLIFATIAAARMR